LDENEMTRVLALDVDERYAYAINKISEQGELWTLASDDGRVVSTNPNGVSSIPIWPHEQFAERGRVGRHVAGPDLWSAVGRTVASRRAASVDPVWVSTAGLGVHWLHVRLDDRPKYYRHRPFTNPTA
jgi:hypothetical protein